jgi:hypothetical protein
MVVLPRSEYEALIEAAEDAAEDAADVAAYDAAMVAGTEPLPFEISQALLKGDSRLKAIRLWRSETQARLAFRTGTSQGLISDLENRRRDMTDEMAGRLGQALDVPPSWLS